MSNQSQRAGVLDFPCDVERLANGHTLIADAGDNTGAGSEIIEVDSAGQVVWRFAEGLRFAHSAKRLPDGNTLITDTTNNRVIEVSPDGRIVLTSDDWGGGTGRLSDGSHLHYPNDAHALDDGSLLITDRNNDRCVIADRAGRVLWQFGGAKHPHNADLLANGHILLANSDDNSVIEIDRDGRIVWSYSSREDPLYWPRDADRLDNGNTLIADSRNGRVIEVTPAGRVVWTFRVNYNGDFYEADPLPDGNVLISGQQHHEVLEVDRLGNIVWQFRNDRRTHPVHPQLMNGSFAQRGADGLPADWMAYVKTSEGGGKVIWDKTGGGPAPGIEFDRNGAFCLYQVVGVEPGRSYRLTGQIRAEMAAGGALAFFQLAFLDPFGGLVVPVIAAPKGTMLTETTDWLSDAVEARAPDNATAVEIRLFISGKGKAWMRDVRFGPQG